MHHLRLPRLLVRPSARFGVPLVIALVVALLPLVAHAGTITVDGTTCTLPEAITAANTDAAFDGCTAGSGTDTLLLGGLTHSLATGPYDHDGMNATPSVTTTIVISGGVGGAIVERSGAEKYRLFHVGVAGDLTLQNTILRNGDVNDDSTYPNNSGGAIYNLGALTLFDSHTIANTAHNAGGIYNSKEPYSTEGGTITIINSTFISNTAADEGGGLLNVTTATIVGSRFVANSAGYGGGIYNVDATAAASLTIIDSDFISNSASSYSGGGGLYNRRGTLTVTNTRFISNTAPNGRGGGIRISDRSTATFTDSAFIANSAGSSGGGIYIFDSRSTLTLINTRFISNITGAEGAGGGLSNSGTLTITQSEFIGNVAGGGGGMSNGGTASLSDTRFISNTALTYNGGGFANYDGKATLTTIEFIGNSAEDDGGGFYNSDSTAILTDIRFTTNSAVRYGGGLYNLGYRGDATVKDSNFIANRAGHGGGIANVGYTGGSGGTSLILINAEIRANTAVTSGGALYQNAQAIVTGARLVDNAAGDSGGAVQQTDGTTTVSLSCIVNNSNTAINHVGGDPIDAAGNWWGVSDGPSGAGPGNGDSVSGGVTVAPILTTVPSDCVFSVAFAKHASTADDLLPGQLLTYTLNISNDGTLAFRNLYVTDALPAAFDLDSSLTDPTSITVNGSSYVITDLLPSQVATITLVGQVNPALSDDILLTNTATLTNSAIGELTAPASNKVVVPLVGWAQESYETSADSGTFTATVTVSPTNPYISVTVQVVITDSAVALTVADVQEITFPPGTSSQPVVVTVVDGEANEPRTIQLGLQSPSGASVGDGSKTNATLSVTQETQAGTIYLPNVQR